jgi:putative NADPH-quinone reductase
MGKTLVIFSHPSINYSIGNKIITETVSQLDNAEVRHLDALYPDFQIDVKAEQEALLTADTIIIQYPLFWYGTPALLKHWMDQVMQFGFAFGGKNYQLEGKKLVVSFTMGSSKEQFPPDVIEKITYPFKGFAKYCRLDFKGVVTSNDINNYSEEAEAKAIQNATEHAKELLELING